MEIDRKTIRALAADSRLDIIKSLAKRRKMPSELSAGLKLSPSTISEHLKILEASGLVKKVDIGHKWVYYELTDKGVNIARPRNPVQFIVALIVGAFMIVLGIFKKSIYSSAASMQNFGSATQSSLETATSATCPVVPEAACAAAAAPFDWTVIILVFSGLLIITAVLFGMIKNVRPP
jgi:DNA-binding transcriptional ArsR family regulator